MILSLGKNKETRQELILMILCEENCNKPYNNYIQPSFLKHQIQKLQQIHQQVLLET